MYAQCRTIAIVHLHHACRRAYSSKQQSQLNESTEGVPSQATQTKTKLTSERLVQAWLSFAMALPENERALADRMRIILPRMQDDTLFSIAVDNQHVAAMFEGESTRILKALEAELGAKLRMRVDVNQVVVQRHVYDRTKQYKILRDKNSLIGKLRDTFELELS